MSDNAFDRPRVRLRLTTDGAPDDPGLPLILGVLGDFSGRRGPRDGPPVVLSTEVQATRLAFGPLPEKRRYLAAWMLRLRPTLTMDLPLPLPLRDAELVFLPASREADIPETLACFGPAALALNSSLPDLRLATLLRGGLRDLAVSGQPRRDAVSLAELAAACRRAAPLPDDPPLPPADADPGTLALAWDHWLGRLVALQARLARLPSGPTGDLDPAGLARIDPAPLLSTHFLPTLWAALRVGRVPWHDVPPGGGSPIRLLLAAAPENLAAVLRGATPLEPEHAGWLAARLEALAGRMLDAVLQHPDFLALEAHWRALGHLLAAAAQPNVHLRVIDLDDAGLRADLDPAVAAQSRLRHEMFGRTLDTYGAMPYSALLCMTVLGPDRADAELARGLAELGQRCVCPVLCSASRGLLDCVLPDHASSGVVLHAAWTRLRRLPAASFLGICGPSLLARSWHGFDPDLPAPLRFAETPRPSAAALPWAGGAVGLAERMLASFDRAGWHVAVTGTAADAGVVLPLHDAPLDQHVPGAATRPAVAAALTEWQEEVARRAGLAAVVRLPGRDAEAFLHAPSVFDPTGAPDARDPALQSRRTLEARLPHLFAATRVAHHLQFFLRRELGRVMPSAAEVRFLASRWLADYTALHADTASLRAERPLRRFEVEVETDPARPGEASLTVRLQPHLQANDVGLELALELPLGALATVPGGNPTTGNRHGA